MDFFLKVDLIGCFRELHVRKFRKFSPDHFYDLKNRFYDKKTDFRPETRESRVRRPGSRQPATSPRGNGFSVLRIFTKGPRQLDRCDRE